MVLKDVIHFIAYRMGFSYTSADHLMEYKDLSLASSPSPGTNEKSIKLTL